MSKLAAIIHRTATHKHCHVCAHTATLYVFLTAASWGTAANTESHLSLQCVYDHLLSYLVNSSVVEKDTVNRRVYRSEKK